MTRWRAILVAGLAVTPMSIGVQLHWWWLTALMVPPYLWGILTIWKTRRRSAQRGQA